MTNFWRRFLVAGLPTVLWLAGRLAAHAGPVPNQTILPPPNPPTQVSIEAQVPMAYAAAGVPGSFRLTRTGSVLGDVTIHYQVSGKAVPGQDYKVLKGTKTIPASRTAVRITINPLPVTGSGGTVKGVRVTLLPSDGYAVSAAAKATVKIVQ